MKLLRSVLGILAASALLAACETDPVPTAGSASVTDPLKPKPAPPATFHN